MKIVSQQIATGGLSTAYAQMAELLRSTSVTRSRLAETNVRRLVINVNGVAPLLWLKAQTCFPRIYWMDRLGQSEVAAVGFAHRPESGLPTNSDLVALGDSGSRYYGGLRFDQQVSQSGRWSDFGSAAFVLPRFELVRHRSETEFVCNLAWSDDGSDLQLIIGQLEELATDVDRTVATMPKLLEQNNTPSRSDWEQAVRVALDDLGRGEMEKIVLARKSELRFDRELDPLSMLQFLDSPACYRFVWQSSPGAAFVSISPERLYRRDGQNIECDSIAGTRPRGETIEDDNRLGRELLHSDKDGREHAFVTNAIRDSLNKLCNSVRGGNEISVLKLRRLQHLRANLRGELRDSVDDKTIIENLHPTPAVAGYPVDKACHYLARQESFDRGWYAGPVGWLGNDQKAEFAVAIRSALVQGDRLTLYAGAGIVEGSDPAQEWDESENKMSQFLALFR